MNSEPRQEPQFDIAGHYDVMAQLDRDIHDDEGLSESEAALAIKLSKRSLERMPESIFLPCFGTGRHIPYLLKAGAKKIVGIDLSPACVAKARAAVGGDPRVTLFEGDLLEFDAGALGYRFDATLVLGNSFADCTDRGKLLELTEAMLAPLKPMSVLIMDYIGEKYLERCQRRAPSEWEAVLYNQPVLDRRTPLYDWKNRIMTIDIQVVDKANPQTLVWTGSYQKAVLGPEDLKAHFRCAKFQIEEQGSASKLNRYVKKNQGRLGMIGQSDWWVAQSQALVDEADRIRLQTARAQRSFPITW